VAVLGVALQAAMPLIGPPTSVTLVHGLGFAVPPVPTAGAGATAAQSPPHDHAAADPSKAPVPSHDGAKHPQCPICLVLLHASVITPAAAAVPVATTLVADRGSVHLEPPPAPSRRERPQARSPPAPA
jgi:hypothetical protein